MSDERRMVAVTVFDGEQYDGDWPTSEYRARLVDTIAWFQTKMAEIPDEYRESAYCKIDSVSGYEGCHYGHIEIGYERPETDEEMADRLARMADERAAQERQELAVLRALQAKYPSVR